MPLGEARKILMICNIITNELMAIKIIKMMFNISGKL